MRYDDIWEVTNSLFKERESIMIKIPGVNEVDEVEVGDLFIKLLSYIHQSKYSQYKVSIKSEYSKIKKVEWFDIARSFDNSYSYSSGLREAKHMYRLNIFGVINDGWVYGHSITDKLDYFKPYVRDWKLEKLVK